VNYAVNNDGDWYPRLNTSFTVPRRPSSKLVDGNIWYHRDPPNRWTCEGSPNAEDWIEIDLGTPRKLQQARLYFLDDGSIVTPPELARVEYFDGVWKLLGELGGEGRPSIPGHRAEVLSFPDLQAQRLRVLLRHAADSRSGLSEVDVLGQTMIQ
jgi:hypothetical protein